MHSVTTGQMPEDDSPAQDRLESLLALARGFIPARVFLTAVELGVFARLDDSPQTAADLARLLDADPRAMDALLHALAALGLLTKQGEIFANVPEVAQYLLPGGGGGFQHAAHVWEMWSRLTEIVKTGITGPPKWPDELSKDFAQAMNHYARASADRVARLVDCTDVVSMLDVGGGGGCFAVAFAKRYPHLTVALVEQSEPALEVATELMTRERLQERVRLWKGDFMADDLGGGYGLALLSSILCLFSAEANLALLGRIKRSLLPGGRVVIRDALVDDARTRPAAAAIFSVHVVLTSRQGRAYSTGEVKRWLRGVGFRDVYALPVHPGELVVGRV